MPRVSNSDWILNEVASLEVDEELLLNFRDTKDIFVVHCVADGLYIVEKEYWNGMVSFSDPMRLAELAEWVKMFRHDHLMRHARQPYGGKTASRSNRKSIFNNILLQPPGGTLRRVSNNSRPRNSMPYSGAGANYLNAQQRFEDGVRSLHWQ